MVQTDERPRELRVVASRMDLEDVSGRVLFPSMAQGPWPPFLRFAETVAAGERIGPDSHAHRGEEVLNYVLDGRVEYEDDNGVRTVLGPGTAVLLTAREEAHHDLVANQTPRVRWLSVVLRIPAAAGGPTHRVQIANGPLPTRDGPARIERPLVGPHAPLASSAGLACTELELRAGGRYVMPLGRERRAVVYVFDGSAHVDDQPVEAGAGALLENATETSIRAVSDARLLLASAPRA
jgi:quercetin 2,3-dioxygenase